MNRQTSVSNGDWQRGKPRILHGAWSSGQGVLHKISVLFGKWGNGVMEKWSLDLYQKIGFLRANYQQGSSCFSNVWLSMEHGAWCKEYCTKYSCCSASGEMGNWIIGVRTFVNRLFLLLVNVLEWISESLVGHRAVSKMEKTIRFLKR